MGRRHLSWTRLGPIRSSPIATTAARSCEGGGIRGDCAVSLSQGVRGHTLLPGSRDHPSGGLLGAKGDTLEGAQEVRISFRPQTKPACGKGEKSARERARAWLFSSPTLRVGGPVPSKPHLLSCPGRPARLHVLRLLTTQRQPFPVLSQLSIDSIFYIYLKHRNV